MKDELSGGATPAHGSDTGNDSASSASIITPLRPMNLQRIVGKLKVGLLAQTYKPGPSINAVNYAGHK